MLWTKGKVTNASISENLQYFEISAKSNVSAQCSQKRGSVSHYMSVQLRETIPLACQEACWVSFKILVQTRLFADTVSNQSLEFVAAPALAPPEVQVDQALIAKYEEELKAAANAPLPDEVSFSMCLKIRFIY